MLLHVCIAKEVLFKQTVLNKRGISSEKLFYSLSIIHKPQGCPTFSFT